MQLGLPGQPLGGRSTTAVVICVLLLIALMPSASTFPYDPEQHSRLVEVASWRDAGGMGTDLRFRLSPDSTRLLLFGYGAQGEVRVTDLDMGNATVLEPPEDGFVATGCDWSIAGDSIVVWGSTNGSYHIAVYDLPSLTQRASVPWIDVVDLVEVTVVTFLGDDLIMAVAGRDSLGTSHLLFIEAQQPAVRRDHVWEGNHTIIDVEDTGGQTIIVDTGDTVTVLKGSGWTEFTRYPGALSGGPVSWNMPYGDYWGIGDGEGGVVLSPLLEDHPSSSITVGDGPVIGLAMSKVRYQDFVVALGVPGGRTRLAGWQLYSEYPATFQPGELCSTTIEGTVTMIAQDPRGWNRVLVALDDGTLKSFQFDIRPLPVEIQPGAPDQLDGRGLEPLVYWNPGGESVENRFYFNHRGSLFALRNFGAPGDIHIINRTFDIVAELDTPWDPFMFGGLEWSSNDRWLLVWGYTGTPDDPKLVLQAYDTPDLNKSSSFPLDEVLDIAQFIGSMEFLQDDEVLAIACADHEQRSQVVFLDLGTNEVITEVAGPGGGDFIDLQWDGNELVAIREWTDLFILSPPSWEYTKTEIVPGDGMAVWDLNGSLGWCFSEVGFNDSLWNGTPAQEALRWDCFPDEPRDYIWAYGHAGVVVLGTNRHAGGSSLQLWRQEPNDTGDWRWTDGYKLISELNTSRSLVQLEADPAFPGIVAASFEDGTLGLYHLNVTPYPPVPDHLGGLETGPIFSFDDGSGNGGEEPPWGSGSSWMFPVALAVILVVLVVLWAVLRSRLPDEDEGEEKS